MSVQQILAMWKMGCGACRRRAPCRTLRSPLPSAFGSLHLGPGMLLSRQHGDRSRGTRRPFLNLLAKATRVSTTTC